jgi:multiple sugar transport system substrate-binding protein
MTKLSRRGIIGGLGAAAALGPTRGKAAGTISVWWTQGFYQAEDQALKDLVAQYEKESGSKVDLQIIPGPDLITKMVAGMQMGDVPDAVQSVTGGAFFQPQSVWKDQILEISDVVATQEKAFLPAALAACRFYNNATKKHGYYGVPIKCATLMEEIWLPLLEEAGFSAGDIPKTQDAYFDFFQIVQDKLRSKGRRIFGLGYSMATKEADSNNLFHSFLVAYGGAGIVTPDGGLHADDDKVRKAITTALERLTTPYKKGYVPPGAINWGDVDNNNAFYAKQIVMTPNATISIAVAQAEKKDQYFKDIITTGIPAGNDGQPVPSILGATSAFIPKGAKNIDGAKAFLRFFIQPANLNFYLKEARGRWLPVMPSALKDDPYWLDPSDPHRPVAAKYGLQLPTIAPWTTYTPAYAQVISEQLWAGAEANITQKSMTPEQATEVALKRVKEIWTQFPIG